MIDIIDEHLIVELSKNARQNSKILAKTLKISPATVRRRIQRLLKDDVIAVIALVDPEKIGLGLVAVIMLNIEPKFLENAVEYLSGREEVAWLATTTGRFDIMATVHQFVAMDPPGRDSLGTVHGLLILQKESRMFRESGSASTAAEIARTVGFSMALTWLEFGIAVISRLRIVCQGVADGKA